MPPALVRTAATGYSQLFPMAAMDSDTRQLFDEFVVPNYGRYDLVLVRGLGSRVWDEDGKEYLDFGGGIAVSTLGHAHPRLVEALDRQARELIHTSNLYYTRPQARACPQTGRHCRFAREDFLFEQWCGGERGGHQAGSKIRERVRRSQLR